MPVADLQGEVFIPGLLGSTRANALHNTGLSIPEKLYLESELNKPEPFPL